MEIRLACSTRSPTRTKGRGSFVSGTADADAARRETLKEDLRKLVGELRYLGVTHEDAMTLIKEVYEQ